MQQGRGGLGTHGGVRVELKPPFKVARGRTPQAGAKRFLDHGAGGLVAYLLGFNGDKKLERSLYCSFLVKSIPCMARLYG